MPGGRHRKTVRAYDGETVDVRIHDPKAAPAAEPKKRSAVTLALEDELQYGRAIIRVFDLGTFGVKAPSKGVVYDDYREMPLEGRPYLNADGRLLNRELLIEGHGQTITLESGEVVPSAYPLQVDEDTGNANVSIELRGPRGSRIGALAPGAEPWVAPRPVDLQRETIARLLTQIVAQSSNYGLDEWNRKLDQFEARRWSVAIDERMGSEGEFRMRTAPQSADLIFRSPWQYESWALGDRQRYMVTHGRTPVSPSLEPAPMLRLSGGRSTRLDIWAAPQLHRVKFDWLDIYLLNVGWWLTIIILPTVRLITLRSAQFPHVFTGTGVPIQDLQVGETMSARIARTNAFASAIVARIFSPLFQHIASVQGRYGVYLRDQEADTLCAVLEYRWPDRDPEVFRVFRIRTIERENTLLELNGLYVPGLVYPWIKGFEVLGQSGGSGDITDGYI